MPKIIAKPQEFDARIRRVLLDGLKTAGIKARIFIEPLQRTRLHRVTVISSEFGQLRPTERQDLIWRIINQEFSPEEQLQISMIVTLSPHELVGLSVPKVPEARQGWDESFAKVRRRRQA
jgi:hypothetical protein